jgi:hypothetical protein
LIDREAGKTIVTLTCRKKDVCMLHIEDANDEEALYRRCTEDT